MPYLLRQQHPEYWFRIHSLPGSQRYPADEADWQILLLRQHTVLSEVLGQHKRQILTGYCTADAQPALATFLAEQPVLAGLRFLELSPVSLAAWPSVHEPDNTCLYWPLLTPPLPASTSPEPLLRAIATDECRAAFLEPESGILVAPYDGGVDVFIPDTAARDHYRARYRAWLSARPDSL